MIIIQVYLNCLSFIVLGNKFDERIIDYVGCCLGEGFVFFSGMEEFVYIGE